MSAAKKPAKKRSRTVQYFRRGQFLALLRCGPVRCSLGDHQTGKSYVMVRNFGPYSLAFCCHCAERIGGAAAYAKQIAAAKEVA